MKNVIAFLITLCMASSCTNREEQVAAKHPVRKVGEQNRLQINKSAENLLNPYDSIGIWHNIILDSLRRYELSSGDTTRSGHNLYLTNFAKKYRNTAISLSYLPAHEDAIRKDFRKVLLSLKLSVRASALLQELITVLDSVESTDRFTDYNRKIQHLENKILRSALIEKESGILLVTASMLRHSGYYWMNEFNQLPEDNVRKSGFLRKVLGAISSVGADVTTAAYHYAKNTRADGIILEASRMSYICGYYTGWYNRGY